MRYNFAPIQTLSPLFIQNRTLCSPPLVLVYPFPKKKGQYVFENDGGEG